MKRKETKFSSQNFFKLALYIFSFLQPEHFFLTQFVILHLLKTWSRSEVWKRESLPYPHQHLYPRKENRKLKERENRCWRAIIIYKSSRPHPTLRHSPQKPTLSFFVSLFHIFSRFYRWL